MRFEPLRVCQRVSFSVYRATMQIYCHYFTTTATLLRILYHAGVPRDTAAGWAGGCGQGATARRTHARCMRPLPPPHSRRAATVAPRHFRAPLYCYFTAVLLLLLRPLPPPHSRRAATVAPRDFRGSVSVYLLYQHKSTKTDTHSLGAAPPRDFRGSFEYGGASR